MSAPEDDPYWSKRKDGSKVHEPAPTPLLRSSKLKLAGLPIVLVLLAGSMASAGVVGYRLAPREIVFDRYSITPTPSPPVAPVPAQPGRLPKATPVELVLLGALGLSVDGCTVSYAWGRHPTRADALSNVAAFVFARKEEGATATASLIRKLPRSSPVLEDYADARFVSAATWPVC